MKVDVWFSIGITMETDDIEDTTRVADKAMPLLLERIRNDGIQDCIENIDIIEE